MQQTHPLGYGMFRSYEPHGFRMLNRFGTAERVARLPDVDDAALARRGWFEAGPVWGEFLDLHDSQPAGKATQMRVLCSDVGLFVGMRCVEADPRGVRALVPAEHPTGVVEVEGAPIGYACWKDDHVRVAIDPTHEAGAYYEFLLTAGGLGQASVKQYAYAEPVQPRQVKDEPAAIAWRRRALKGEDGAWYAFMEVPWVAMGLDGPPEPGVIGFNAIRLASRPEMTWSAWARVVNPQEMPATDLGDCHLGAARVVVPVSDFGYPVLDENVLKVTLCAPEGALRARVRAVVESSDGAGVISDRSVEVDLPGGGREANDEAARTVEVPYRLDWQERKEQVVTLEVAEAGTSRVIFRTRYRAGRSADVCATDRFEFDQRPMNPSPDDEDFVTKKRNWLNWKLGQFHRKTTVQGAPSDFCVARADGEVVFNFMSADVCRTIARYVEGQFEDDLDRMCAAVLLLHQKTFVMHHLTLTSMHRAMTPESALRLNGGHCYARALALAGVMQQMRYAGSDRRYDAAITYVLGHVIVVVREADGSRYLFDPTYGSFFYHHDNRRLATEQELYEDPSLHERYVRNRRANFCSPGTHADGRVGRVVWPTGAPIEAGAVDRAAMDGGSASQAAGARPKHVKSSSRRRSVYS